MPEDGFGGAGLCSPKMTAHGEWRSACWDSDYFDGSNDPERETEGPDEWFSSLWERDFPVMKDLGVNTIRIYNINPTTRKASQELLSQGWNDIVKPYGKDHVPFLDYAYQHGLKVIYPLVSDESALTLDPRDLLEQKMKNIIDEVGYHPAILMWAIGNELSLEDPEKVDLLQTVNEMADLAREYTLQRFNRILPITHCTVDLPESYQYLVDNLNVDVFCSNAGYRSDSLTDLYTGNPSRGFPGWKKLSEESGKPLLIGEIGWLSINNTAYKENPGWFNNVWKEVIEHIDDGCIGGIFFEYSDEKYKKSGPDQKQLGVVTLVPYEKDGKSTEEDENFLYPDIVVKKDYIYDSIKNGTVDGVPINFNTDVFQYLGREPATIDTVESPVINEYPEPTNKQPVDIPFPESHNPNFVPNNPPFVGIPPISGANRIIYQSLNTLVPILLFVFLVI